MTETFELSAFEVVAGAEELSSPVEDESDGLISACEMASNGKTRYNATLVNFIFLFSLYFLFGNKWSVKLYLVSNRGAHDENSRLK